MKEIWKPIPGFRGMYEISNFGKVRSWRKTRWGKSDTPKLLRPWLSEKGYLKVWLTKRQLESRSYTVHSLVALVFIGKRPAGLQVSHIDGNSKNNHYKNLIYETDYENKHRHFDRVARGERINFHKITEDQARKIRGMDYRAAMKSGAGKEFGISDNQIKNIRKVIYWGWLAEPNPASLPGRQKEGK